MAAKGVARVGVAWKCLKFQVFENAIFVILRQSQRVLISRFILSKSRSISRVRHNRTIFLICRSNAPLFVKIEFPYVSGQSGMAAEKKHNSTKNIFIR